MTGETFGDRLAATRLKRGLSIEQVSEVLRIRSSIIEALETGNYSRMPLKGYTRNMVSSYARYLGLNSTEMTEHFLREYHEFEKNQQRIRSAGIDVPTNVNGDNRQGVPGRQVVTPPRRNNDSEREVVNLSSRHKGSRSYWSSTDPATLNRQVGTNPYLAPVKKQPTGRRSAARDSIRNQHYTSRRSRNATIQRHPILFILALLVIVLVVLIGWALLANNCMQDNSGTVGVTGGPPAPAEGIDPADIDANAAEVKDLLDEDTRYGPFDIYITVSGKASWLRISVDGKTEVEGIISAGEERTFMVTSSVTIEAGVPGSVRVYRGKTRDEVELDTSGGVGYLKLDVEEKPIKNPSGSSDERVPNANDEEPEEE